MKKEHLLMVGSVLFTLAAALLVIRWIAPQLLGLPTDLRMVQTAKEVPPFFGNVFRDEDMKATEIVLPDPTISVRGRPLVQDQGGSGPQDVLGFRNRAVPNLADVVVIGDSQTYGNNVPLEDNWPSQMSRLLPGGQGGTYAMATGGWGAVQYLAMAPYASRLQPRVLVVAFYSGNDPLESFTVAYNMPQWAQLRPNPKLTAADAPKVVFPTPESEWWRVRFADGMETIFTPTLRLAANEPDHPAVKAGYAIMADVARRIVTQAGKVGIPVVVTVIPTKELAYGPRVERERLAAPPAYRQLVEAEKRNIDSLVQAIRGVPGAIYVDSVQALQQAAMGGILLYPADGNGHPVAAGYGVIGKTIAAAVAPRVPAKPKGVVALMQTDKSYTLLLANREGVWKVESEKILEANGWRPGQVATVSLRDLAGISLRGTLDRVDPARFGPKSVQ